MRDRRRLSFFAPLSLGLGLSRRESSGQSNPPFDPNRSEPLGPASSATRPAQRRRPHISQSHADRARRPWHVAPSRATPRRQRNAHRMREGGSR